VKSYEGSVLSLPRSSYLAPVSSVLTSSTLPHKVRFQRRISGLVKRTPVRVGGILEIILRSAGGQPVQLKELLLSYGSSSFYSEKPISGAYHMKCITHGASLNSRRQRQHERIHCTGSLDPEEPSHYFRHPARRGPAG